MLHIGRKPGEPFKQGLTFSRYLGLHTRLYRATVQVGRRRGSWQLYFDTRRGYIRQARWSVVLPEV